MSEAVSGRPRRFWLRALGTLALTGVLTLAVMLGWLKAHEDQLVFQAAVSHARHEGLLPPYAEPLSIRESGGSSLAAILFHADPAHDSGFWVMHFHGNADTAFSGLQLRHCEQLRAWGLNVLSFDYRGFGRSPGAASEAHIYEDAEAAYGQLIQRGVLPTRIILWGHSLGSAPAVELAVGHSAAALVLFGAFRSIPDAAADAYPYLPVRWIVGIQMNSLQRIRNVHIPVLIVHSLRDTVIPFDEGQRLYAAANEPKRFLALAGAVTDGFGGHVNALYDQLGSAMPLLSMLVGARLGSP